MKIDYRHFLYALALGFVHAVFATGLWVIILFISPMYVLGFAFILLRNMKGFFEGLVYGLMYIIPGYIIHLLFLPIGFWGHVFDKYYLWNYMNALSVGLILLSCVMGMVNKIKSDEEAENETRIKIDFRHIIYAIIIAVINLGLLWTVSTLKWPHRGMTLLAFAPVLLIGSVYFTMREVKGFVNGLIHGSIYLIIGFGLLSLGYSVFPNIMQNLPWFLVSNFIQIVFGITLLVLAGIIGWVNQTREDGAIDFLNMLNVSEKIEIEDR